MERNIKDFLRSENGEEMAVRGLISDLTEGITRTGKPFVNGVLFASGETMPFKVWDTGLEEFQSEKGVKIGKAALLHGTTNINPQNGEKQLVLRDGSESPALSLLGEDEAEGLASATVIPIGDMWKAITRSAAPALVPRLDEDEPGVLARAYRKAEEELGARLGAPYSCTLHGYKGGFVEHIYNVIYKILYPTLPKGVEVNKGIIFISVLMYHLGWLHRMMYNEMTGLVEYKDEVKLSTPGGVWDFAYAMSLLDNVENQDMYNLRHCIGVLNGLEESVSLEAVLSLSYVREELDVEAVREATQNLEPYSRGFRVVEGKTRTFVKF